jgi:hypothetical protein
MEELLKEARTHMNKKDTEPALKILDVQSTGFKFRLGGSEDTPVNANYYCLPETIDPRGPKGK